MAKKEKDGKGDTSGRQSSSDKTKQLEQRRVASSALLRQELTKSHSKASNMHLNKVQ